MSTTECFFMIDWVLECFKKSICQIYNLPKKILLCDFIYPLSTELIQFLLNAPFVSSAILWCTLYCITTLLHGPVATGKYPVPCAVSYLHNNSLSLISKQRVAKTKELSEVCLQKKACGIIKNVSALIHSTNSCLHFIEASA